MVSLFVCSQLDGVAVRIENPELTASHSGRRFEELDTFFLERAFGLVEIRDVERHVRSERIGLEAVVLDRDQMQRAVADSYHAPGTPKSGRGMRLRPTTFS